MKRVFRVLDVVVTTFLVLLVVTATWWAVAARRSVDSIPTFFGRKILTVLSGSMAPAIRAGDVILVKPTLPGQTLGEGDIITFRSGSSSTMLITHRVVGILRVNGVATAYVTKGDANPSQDGATVSPLQVVGRYQGRIPYFGYVANFIRMPLGTVTVVILPGGLLIASELRRIWRIVAEAEQGTEKKERSAG